MPEITEKRCCECGESKPTTEFLRRSDKPHLWRSQCKRCLNARGRKWRQANPDRAKEANERWRVANPDYGRQRREADPDYFRRYYKRHRELLKARAREARMQNPERELARSRTKRARKATDDAAPWQVILEYTESVLRHARCAYCGGPHEAVDHVVPVARGGAHVPENLVSACGPCNAEKWAYPLGRLLDRKPSEDWHIHATQMAASSAASFGLAPVA